MSQRFPVSNQWRPGNIILTWQKGNLQNFGVENYPRTNPIILTLKSRKGRQNERDVITQHNLDDYEGREMLS